MMTKIIKRIIVMIIIIIIMNLICKTSMLWLNCQYDNIRLCIVWQKIELYFMVSYGIGLYCITLYYIFFIALHCIIPVAA